jgi:CubicO group peptidase (beta-lactamase class C family)
LISLQEKKIKKEIAAMIPGVTPGLILQVFSKGQKKIDIEVGETYPYYDLASLTKIMFTVTMMMHFFENKPKILEEKVLKYLPWYFQPTLGIRELLTHTSGLAWWKPLYSSLDLSQTRQARWEFLKTLLAEEKPEEVVKATYSDLNLLFLGYVLEAEFKKPLEELWAEVQDEFDLKKTHFHLDNKPVYPVNKYAPTEECRWRNRRMQGEVHDENAWALGGVAPHAGLFGNIDDVSQWINTLRNIYFGKKKNKFISQETVQTFSQRAISQAMGDFALGFMIKSAQNSTAGTLMSKNTIGHTGFTGTSIWFDLTNDLIVCILSNRVFYGRENGEAFRKLRSQVHDLVFKEIVK